MNLAGVDGHRAELIDETRIDLGIDPIIPSKSYEVRDARMGQFDMDCHRRRSIVKRSIGRLEECRRAFA